MANAGVSGAGEPAGELRQLLLAAEASPGQGSAFSRGQRLASEVGRVFAQAGARDLADLAEQVAAVLGMVTMELLAPRKEVFHLLFDAVACFVGESDGPARAQALASRLRGLIEADITGGVLPRDEQAAPNPGDPPPAVDARDETLAPELLAELMTEADEILVQLDRDLMLLEEDPENGDLVNRIFRGVHTIKGASGFVGQRAIYEVSNVIEEILDGLRKKRIAPSPELIDAILEGTRVLAGVVRATPTGAGEPASVDETMRMLRGQLERAVGGTAAQAGPTQPAAGGAADVTKTAAVSVGIELERTVRVDVTKLDLLMNRVGELLVQRIRLDQLARRFETLTEEAETRARRSAANGRGGRADTEFERHAALLRSACDELLAAGEHLGRLTAGLQDSAISTRMVPVSFVLDRFPRLVRSIAHGLGREVRLVVVGGATECDRTVIEHLADPLLHLVRNAIDHGIEPPERRAERGKPRQGLIRLAAYHRGSDLVLEVEDDGAGIDTAALIRQALARGILSAAEAATMPADEALRLIFAPGLSTATQISDISGRGVGMDVVAANIAKLKGRVVVESELGVGTLLTIRLPITLAILEALLVTSGGQTFALPLAAVEQALEVAEAAIRRVGGREVVQVHDRTITLLRLRELLRLTGQAAASADGLPVVLLGAAERRIAVAVDTLAGKQEVVVRTLGTVLEHVPFLAGGTIMGDGGVVPILDVAQMVEAASSVDGAPAQPSRGAPAPARVSGSGQPAKA
ncbi:MAG: chemotaxis protein CheA [Candidatus Schekmanbacteria bacterium]|nr:chemotaxis protein CheA [Candidatus Schekmanbacteria bacterium]